MADIYLMPDFEPKSSHSYFLDANILLYAFSAIGSFNQSAQQKITDFLEKSKRVGSSLVVTSMVISEFYNVSIKDAYSEWQQTQSDGQKLDYKKDFRESDTFKQDNLAIQASIRAIFKVVDRYPDDFNAIDMATVLNNCENADYNDAYFLTLAQRKDWIIVSNDRDLINHPQRRVAVVTSLKN